MKSSPLLRLILIAIAVLAIVVPALVATHVTVTPHRAKVVRPQRVVAKTELPPVEPVEFQQLDPEDARSFNAGVPFVTGPNPAARPFRFAGDATAFARATDCLAAAVWYEAGDDAVGEQAVSQVVLNRVRHPAFPKTVCGVVFQGSERTTGCQFTFACDGAMGRTPSDVAWRRARDVAQAALAGQVYKPVGYATHYHTDWVVPYWQASLDKIAAVHTHLFFRWTGWWGTPPAFNRTVDPAEPAIAALGRLSEAHRIGGALVEADAAIAGATPFFGRAVMPLASDQDSFLTSLNPAQSAGFSALARQACGERAKCKFMGWTDPASMGLGLPLAPDQMAAMSFSYIRDRASGLERTLWNCAEFPATPRAQCMKRQVLRIEAPVASEPGTAETAKFDELFGVRRKPQPATAPTPQPQPQPTPPVQLTKPALSRD